jgi:tol-pal system protein YbgF
MFPRLCVWVLIASPTLAFAASKEILELQRDLTQLQQQVRDLQRSQDEKFAALQVLVQQAVDNASKANTAVAVIQSGFQQNIRDTESKVVAPVVGLSSRMDQVSNDLRTVQQAVSDVTGLMSKLQAQLTDLGNSVKIMQAPPPPPPAQTSQGGGANAVPETPTISATDLYSNARRDLSGGKLDLALQEFSDYLKWYGSTDLAPNAQFYIASIHSSQGDYDHAVSEFDMVLEKYPDNNKTPDALYNKGLALTKMGRRTDGAQEYRELIQRFPANDLSKRACDQLKGMGLNCTVARAAAPAKSAPKRTTKKQQQ